MDTKLKFLLLSLIILLISDACRPLKNVEHIEAATAKKWFITEKNNVLKTNLECEFRNAIANARFVYRCNFDLGYPVYLTIYKPSFCEMTVILKEKCVAKLQDYTLGEMNKLTKKEKEKIKTGLRSVDAFDSAFFYYIPAKEFILGYRTTPSTNMYNAAIPEEYEFFIAKQKVSFHISDIEKKSDLKHVMQHLDYSKL